MPRRCYGAYAGHIERLVDHLASGSLYVYQESDSQGLVKSGDILPLFVGGGDTQGAFQVRGQKEVWCLFICVKSCLLNDQLHIGHAAEWTKMLATLLCDHTPVSRVPSAHSLLL